MNEPIITIKNIGKRYNITHQRGGYITLRDILANILHNPFRFIRKKAKQVIGTSAKEEFWALTNINLEIKKGEILGIIGHNGAGKSTLLKILTGITPPTEGEIKINGRIASLLEVGTGFHPELTGRENIFLNGAILGMTRKEIARKFNEIVTFAGIEKFLDTPVKYYSSGMYVRLAFSVAAHLEPDILLVDEVLAVGDAEFQKKCLGKMEEVTHKDGRTIIFVSHNMNAIKQLCNKCILLEKGQVKVASDNVESIINQYLSAGMRGSSKIEWVNSGSEYKNDYFFPRHLAVSGTGPIKNNNDIMLSFSLDILKEDPRLNIGYALYQEDGELIYWSSRADKKEHEWPKLKMGSATLVTKIPRHLLNEGTYFIEWIAWLHNTDWIIKQHDAPSIAIQIQGGLSDSPYWTTKRPGVIAPVIDWNIENNDKKV